MARPVTPVRSLRTWWSWRFIWVRAFCMCWVCVPRAGRGCPGAGGGSARRRPPPGAGRRPGGGRHSGGTGATGSPARRLPARDVLHVAGIDQADLDPLGLQDLVQGNPVHSPVDSMATEVTPQRREPGRRGACRSSVKVPKRRIGARSSTDVDRGAPDRSPRRCSGRVARGCSERRLGMAAPPGIEGHRRQAAQVVPNEDSSKRDRHRLASPVTCATWDHALSGLKHSPVTSVRLASAGTGDRTRTPSRRSTASSFSANAPSPGLRFEQPERRRFFPHSVRADMRNKRSGASWDRRLPLWGWASWAGGWSRMF